MIYIIYSKTFKKNIFGSKLINSMLWNNKDDMIFFKNKTSNPKNENERAIIMGKNTALSLKTPLKNRLNIVISSSSSSIFHKDFIVYDNVDKAINDLYTIYKVNKIFIIGGVNLIEYVLSNYTIRKMYISNFNLSQDELKLDNINHTENDFIYGPNIYFDYTTYKEKHLNKIVDLCIYKQKIQNKFGNEEEQNYLNLLKEIIIDGEKRNTRNGITYSLFGKSLTFNLENNVFPLLTTKKMFLRGIFEELKFFLIGDTNTKNLSNKGVKIWDKNTSKEFLSSLNLNYVEGEMGPMYGFQLRNFNGNYNENLKNGIDQFKNIIELLKTDKFSRRLIMTTFNPIQANDGVLYPCHGIVIQFYVSNKNKLNCIMHQRSADMFLGVPFNIASYALLMHIICKIVNDGMTVGKLIMNFGDIHIYEQHVLPTLIQLKNQPLLFPTLNIDYPDELTLDNIESLNFENIKLNNYVSHQRIVADMIA